MAVVEKGRNFLKKDLREEGELSRWMCCTYRLIDVFIVHLLPSPELCSRGEDVESDHLGFGTQMRWMGNGQGCWEYWQRLGWILKSVLD